MIRQMANQKAYSGANTGSKKENVGGTGKERRSLEQAQFSGTSHSLGTVVDAEFAVDVF